MIPANNQRGEGREDQLDYERWEYAVGVRRSYLLTQWTLFLLGQAVIATGAITLLSWCFPVVVEFSTRILATGTSGIPARRAVVALLVTGLVLLSFPFDVKNLVENPRGAPIARVYFPGQRAQCVTILGTRWDGTVLSPAAGDHGGTESDIRIAVRDKHARIHVLEVDSGSVGREAMSGLRDYLASHGTRSSWS